VLFWECRVTHEPREESLDGVSCFPVSPGIQVISEILESLLIPIGLLQPLYNLLLMFPGNIPQDGPGAMHLTYLSGCTEEGGFRRLLDACMPIRDDQFNPGESLFFEVLEQSQPGFFILTVGDPSSQDLPVAVVPDARRPPGPLGDVSCSVPDFVVGGIHEEVWDRLFDRPQEECLHLVVEVPWPSGRPKPEKVGRSPDD